MDPRHLLLHSTSLFIDTTNITVIIIDITLITITAAATRIAITSIDYNICWYDYNYTIINIDLMYNKSSISSSIDVRTYSISPDRGLHNDTDILPKNLLVHR